MLYYSESLFTLLPNTCYTRIESMECESLELSQRNWPNTRVLANHLKKLLGVQRWDRRYYYESKQGYNTIIYVAKKIKVVIHYRKVRHAHLDTMDVDEYISVIDVVICRE